jgi:hypothetical protein
VATPRRRFSVTDVPNGVRHVLASAVSGALAVSALAPVEVVRVNMLLHPDWSLQTAIKSLSSGWFRGNTADVLFAATRVGITMPAFAFYKTMLQGLAGSREEGAALLPPGVTAFIAGALAGCTASIACFPLEVARTRLAVACDVRLGVAGCILAVLREEGLFNLYSGISTTLAGVLPFNAMKLSSYDFLRRQALAAEQLAAEQKAAAAGRGKRRGEAAPPPIDERSISLPVPTVAAIGATSGVVAATSCYPLEVVRRRQMAGEFSGLSATKAAASLVRAEGPSALFKGIGVNCLKVTMSNSLGFVLYELTMDSLQVDGRITPWERRRRRRQEEEEEEEQEKLKIKRSRRSGTPPGVSQR